MSLVDPIHYDKNRIKIFLRKGIEEGVYPGAVLVVAQNGQILFFQGVGHLSLVPDPRPMGKEKIFDLASLTKPLATTLALMGLVDKATIALDQPLSELITTSPLKDKGALTPRLLLNHSAGLTDWKPFYQDLMEYRLQERKSVLRQWIIEDQLAYPPGRGCLYSDLGFMILEWLIEEVVGTSMAMYLGHNFYERLSLERTFLDIEGSPSSLQKEMFAATEVCPWRGELVQGRVHDENAYALGGYSGHAGLFGDAQGVFTLVNLLRDHYQGRRNDYFRQETVREFFRRQDIFEGSTWALGWDTPSVRESSSGTYFSPRSVGHLGFTGTSIWMELELDVIIIFLTNRVHPTRNNEKIKAFRPRLHDLVMEELKK